MAINPNSIESLTFKAATVIAILQCMGITREDVLEDLAVHLMHLGNDELVDLGLKYALTNTDTAVATTLRSMLEYMK